MFVSLNVEDRSAESQRTGRAKAGTRQRISRYTMHYFSKSGTAKMRSQSPLCALVHRSLWSRLGKLVVTNLR